MRACHSGSSAACAHEHADAPHPLALLRARRERPRSRRAAEQRDELAPLHSITSSARASSVRRHVEAERLGGLEIDDQLELGRLLHRQVGWLLALEDAIDIGRPHAGSCRLRRSRSPLVRRPRRITRVVQIAGRRVAAASARIRRCSAEEQRIAAARSRPPHVRPASVANAASIVSACGLRLGRFAAAVSWAAVIHAHDVGSMLSALPTLTSTPMRPAPGTNSLQSSSRFAARPSTI